MSFRLLFFLPLAILAGCSGKSHLSINNTPQQTYLIPAQTFSCYAKAVAAASTSTITMTYDVSAKYFQLQGVNFSWNDPNTTLYIATINLTFTIPGTSTAYTCAIAGNELLSTYAPTLSGAIPTSWVTTGVATVTSSAPVTLTCPITCGGVTTTTADPNTGNQIDTGFTANASMEVIGYSQGPALNSTQTPVYLTSYFDVVNIGSQ